MECKKVESEKSPTVFSRIHLIFCQYFLSLKGPIALSVINYIFYSEVLLPASHYSFVIVNDHDWPTLI